MIRIIITGLSMNGNYNYNMTLPNVDFLKWFNNDCKRLQNKYIQKIIPTAWDIHPGLVSFMATKMQASGVLHIYSGYASFTFHCTESDVIQNALKQAIDSFPPPSSSTDVTHKYEQTSIVQNVLSQEQASAIESLHAFSFRHPYHQLITKMNGFSKGVVQPTKPILILFTSRKVNEHDMVLVLNFKQDGRIVLYWAHANEPDLNVYIHAASEFDQNSWIKKLNQDLIHHDNPFIMLLGLWITNAIHFNFCNAKVIDTFLELYIHQTNDPWVAMLQNIVQSASKQSLWQKLFY